MFISTPPEPRGEPRRSFSAQRNGDMSRRDKPRTPKTRFVWYPIRCHTHQGPVTQRHTLGMTSARLSTKGTSPTRSHDLCHCHHMWKKFQGQVERVQRAIRKVVRSPGFRS